MGQLCCLHPVVERELQLDCTKLGEDRVISTEARNNWIESPKGACAYFSVLALLFLLSALAMSPVLGYVVSRPGGENNILIVLASLTVILLWSTLVIRGQWLHAFGLQLLLLNVTARASELAGVVEYTNFLGEPETASATTLLIGLIWMAAVMRPGSPRPLGKTAQSALLLFAFFGALATASQFFNHSVFSAFWLSITGVWQYALVGYVVVVAIKSREGAETLQRYMIASVILSVVIRLATRGEFWFQMIGRNPVRLGSIAFGPSNYYSSTVAIVFTLCLGLLLQARTSAGRLLCAIALGILGMEQISTYTRGGYVALAILFLLPLWKTQRRFILKLCAAIGILGIAFGRWILPLILFRPIDLQENSVQDRLWLIVAALPHVFDNFGFGHGIANYIIFSDPTGTFGSQLPVHAFLLESSQMVGAWATCALIAFFAYIAFRLLKVSRTDFGPRGQGAIFLLLAILGWHLYANTTGTSILCYAPQEASVLVYTLMFMGVRLIDLPPTTAISAHIR